MDARRGVFHGNSDWGAGRSLVAHLPIANGASSGSESTTIERHPFGLGNPAVPLASQKSQRGTDRLEPADIYPNRWQLARQRNDISALSLHVDACRTKDLGVGSERPVWRLAIRS